MFRGCCRLWSKLVRKKTRFKRTVEIRHSVASFNSDVSHFVSKAQDPAVLCIYSLTLLHSERPKLNGVLAILSAIGLMMSLVSDSLVYYISQL